MSATKEQLIAEALTFTHADLAGHYAEVCVEREKTVSNLRAVLEESEARCLRLRRHALDSLDALTKRLEAM